MLIKEYKQEYEKVFTNKENLPKKCDINQITTFFNDPPIETYTELLRKNYKELHQILFDYLVKIFWLNRRFVYKGKRRLKPPCGEHMDKAWSYFMRLYVGFDHRFVMNKNTLSRITTYFDDFFPNFDLDNPFEKKYEYPYKHIGLDFLSLVFKMDERLELLDIAERDKMNYQEFRDYIINWYCCYNNEIGYDKYNLKRFVPEYIMKKQDERTEKI